MLSSLREYMHRQSIRDKMKQITMELFGFEIVDEELVKKIEDQMYAAFEVAGQSMKPENDEKEMLISVILALLDLTLTHIITLNLQDRYIENFINRGKGDEDEDQE